MYFRQLQNDDASLSYLLACGGHGKAVAVDVVAGRENWFIEQARSLKVSITHVLDTHLHADHYSGGRELAARVGARYGLHESDVGKAAFDFMPLRDGDVIEAGNTRVAVLHTPGHTEDSVSLLVVDRRRGESPWFVLTGDTLFVGSVGRPDLAGREREMAGVLWESLQKKLLVLPEDMEIFPGHQAGSACGVGLSGKPSSTIGFEKRWNPLLTVPKEEFIRAITREPPPRPANMDEIIAANLGRATVATAPPAQRAGHVP
ncbi:MAG: MBL fold metallo-hydrolase [Sulfurifustaceae bacterium]